VGVADDVVEGRRQVPRPPEGPQLLLERDQGDALALWSLAGSWCGDQRTDGAIPAFVMRRWFSDWQARAAALVDVNLWHVSELEGREVYQFHDYTDVCTCPGRGTPAVGRGWNPSKAKAEADAVHTRKVALHRDPQLVAAVRGRDQERCRYCGCAVDFNDRRSNMGGTYDHVDPEGANNLANVVIACRGCNSAKGHRTPEEWGYALLKPGSMGPARRLRPVSGTDLDTSQNGEGSRPGRAGSGSGLGSGRVGSGSETYLDTEAETGTGAA
jgi:5-methylcytosine-specific restriction endonuclease McrA